MKTIKTSLALHLLIIVITFSFVGCYTQLAFVDDDQDSTDEPTPMISLPIPFVPYVPPPIWDPPAPAPISTLPPAGSIKTGSEPQPPSQTRETGYQRSSESGNRQASSSGSDTRTSGTRHNGR